VGERLFSTPVQTSLLPRGKGPGHVAHHAPLPSSVEIKNKFIYSSIPHQRLYDSLRGDLYLYLNFCTQPAFASRSNSVYPKAILRLKKSIIYEKLMDAVVMVISIQKLMLA
jgi:hypothetical protein